MIPTVHTPSSREIASARGAVGLSQQAAAALVYCTKRAWQAWEAGDRAIPPEVWELFLRKTGQFNGTLDLQPKKSPVEPG